MTQINVRTNIWHDDREIAIDFPTEWDVTTFWPKTPEPLSGEELIRCIDEPIGSAPLEERLTGAKKVAIIVDDLTRPTPVYKVMPILIDKIKNSNQDIDITVIIATGTHGSQDEQALRNKLGEYTYQKCTVILHNDLKGTKKIGVTSYKTPVYINKSVLDADLLIGVGGVYPQHTTGFGGGGKLALGISGRQTIMGLHFKHESMGGKYNTDNNFRKDVTEIAKMIGLDIMLTLHIDAHSRIVRAVFGNHTIFYDEAAKFSKDMYTAPVATDADVIIANAYPLDTSLTFMRKGYKPLYTAPDDKVKIMIAAAHEGVGVHGLFQYINPNPFSRVSNILLRAWSMDKKELLQKVWNRVARSFLQFIR